VKGAIRKGRKPETWELRVSLGRDALTGKYGQLSRTFEGARRDAQTALAELIAEISRDSHMGRTLGTSDRPPACAGNRASGQPKPRTGTAMSRPRTRPIARTTLRRTER